MNPLDTSWDNSREGFRNILWRTGLPFRVVDSEYIEKNLEYGEHQKVLILPAVQAMSAQETAKVKAFAEKGGLVIADFVPAVFDEYLRPQGTQSRQTEDVKTETCPKCKGTGKFDTGTTVMACPLCGGSGKVVVGGTVKLTSALGDVFDFSKKGAKKCGNGYGLFLNGFPVKQEEWSGIRKAIVEIGGVKPLCEVTDRMGNPRTDVKTYIVRDGKGFLLGLIPDRTVNDPPGPVLRIKTGEKYHVYDVRLKKYLGYLDEVEAGIQNTAAKLLAFLPERVEGIKLSTDKTACRKNDIVTVRGRMLPRGLDGTGLAARIEVRRGGEIIEAYSKNIDFNGEFSYTVPLSLNEKPGTYTVNVTDPISGCTGKASFEVRN